MNNILTKINYVTYVFILEMNYLDRNYICNIKNKNRTKVLMVKKLFAQFC